MVHLRISQAFGQGDISQSLAEKIGKVYGSLAFGHLDKFSRHFKCLRTGSGYCGEQRLHNRLRREGLTLACDVSSVELPLKVARADGSEVMEVGSWPILLPHDLFQCFLDAGREDLLVGSKPRHLEYWELMVKDYHDLDVSDPSNTVPLTLYGDECTIFRQSCMALHLQPILSEHRTNSMMSRFLVGILPSDVYWNAPGL